MFDCSEDVLILDPSQKCSTIVKYQYFAAAVLVVWAILPYLLLVIQLCRHQRHLEQQMNDSSTFRILYGWAISKYRYSNEVFNMKEKYYYAVKKRSKY